MNITIYCYGLYYCPSGEDIVDSIHGFGEHQTTTYDLAMAGF